ncbi:uncharacterized protein VTP21DRAFT_1560 [Calcarisporiella thermophila]|uniref:uncharacterized protein n=1 Tax=Calcarisporiella thermophila TaxID=911321 RepID=UPI0037430473
MQAARDKRASASRLAFSSTGDPVIQELEQANKHLKDFAKWAQEDSINVIAYFKERIEIEENYTKSLERLVAKQTELDASRKSIESKARSTTYFQAWSYLYHTTEMLAARRRHFVGSLHEIDRKLQDMLNKHEMMRLRSKDVLKAISSQYLEMRVTTVPKLKRNYEIKCRELNQALQSQNNQNSSHLQDTYMRPGDSSSSSSLVRDGSSDSLDHAYTTTPPYNEDTHTHSREPKGLEKFINMFSNLNSNTDMVKIAKIRKEIVENENEYRKAVVELDSLREEQTSTMNWAFQMLNFMLKEKTSYLKGIFGRYVILEKTLQQTVEEAVNQFKVAIDCVNPELDAEIFMDALKNVANYRPAKVCYENYYAGPCKDIIFGIPLTAYAKARKRSIPILVEKCIKYIDERGLHVKGVYRVSARQNLITKLRHSFEKDEEGTVFGVNGVPDDLPAIAGLLKNYFRELPEPLFPFPIPDRVEYSKIPDEATRLRRLKVRLRSLPDAQLETLRALVLHLARVVEQQDYNMMTLTNLSLIFTPVIFQDHNRTDTLPPSQQGGGGGGGGAGGSEVWFNDCVLSDLVRHGDEVFAVLPRLAPISNVETTIIQSPGGSGAGEESRVSGGGGATYEMTIAMSTLAAAGLASPSTPTSIPSQSSPSAEIPDAYNFPRHPPPLHPYHFDSSQAGYSPDLSPGKYSPATPVLPPTSGGEEAEAGLHLGLKYKYAPLPEVPRETADSRARREND